MKIYVVVIQPEIYWGDYCDGTVIGIHKKKPSEKILDGYMEEYECKFKSDLEVREHNLED